MRIRERLWATLLVVGLLASCTFSAEASARPPEALSATQVAAVSAAVEHLAEPTAPIESVQLIVTDLETGEPIPCNGAATDARAALVRGFVTAEPPSEHWATSLNVKTRVRKRKLFTSGKSQWNANFSHQNHGQTFPSEPGDPFFVAGNRMEFIIAEQVELTTFDPMIWRLDVNLIGDVSNRLRKATCAFKTVEQPEIDFGLPPLMALPGPATHHEASVPITDFTLRAGTYPGLSQDPNRCDGTDLHDGSMRIEPLAHYRQDPPTEHWDFHMQFIRFGSLAWSVAWPHQNFGHGRPGNKGEVGGLNNYDFGDFSRGDYELRMRLAGQHSRVARDVSCPFIAGD